MKSFKEIREQIEKELTGLSGDEYNLYCRKTFLQLDQLYPLEINEIIESLNLGHLEESANKYLENISKTDLEYSIYYELGVIQIKRKGSLVNRKLIYPKDLIKTGNVVDKVIGSGYIFSIFEKINLYFALTRS
jgi:hypothetical protein